MTVTAQLPADARCRGCDYPLRGLDSSRCPECGRTFDRGDTRSVRSAVNAPWWIGLVFKPVSRRDRALPAVATALLAWGLRVPGWGDCFIWFGITLWAAILLGLLPKLAVRAVLSRRSPGLWAVPESEGRFIRSTQRWLLVSALLCAVPIPMYLSFYASERFFDRVRRRVYSQPFASKPQESGWIGLYYISHVDRCPHGLQFDIDTFNRQFPGEAFIYKDDPGRCVNHAPTDRSFGRDWYTAK